MLGNRRDLVLFAFSLVAPVPYEGLPAAALIVIPSAERDLQFRLRLRTVVAGSFAVAFAPRLPPIRISQPLIAHGLPYFLITEP